MYIVCDEVGRRSVYQNVCLCIVSKIDILNVAVFKYCQLLCEPQHYTNPLLIILCIISQRLLYTENKWLHLVIVHKSSILTIYADYEHQ